MYDLLSNLWQEPDVSSGVKDEKKATLLMMNFSEDEVDYAINKLGMLNFLEWITVGTPWLLALCHFSLIIKIMAHSIL